MQIGTYFEKDLMYSLEIYKLSGPGENQTLKDDFDAVQYLVNDKLLSSVRLIMHVLPHHLKLNTEPSNSETGSLAFTEVETCSIKCNTMNFYTAFVYIESKNKYMELGINRISSF